MITLEKRLIEPAIRRMYQNIMPARDIEYYTKRNMEYYTRNYANIRYPSRSYLFVAYEHGDIGWWA